MILFINSDMNTHVRHKHSARHVLRAQAKSGSLVNAARKTRQSVRPVLRAQRKNGSPANAVRTTRHRHIQTRNKNGNNFASTSNKCDYTTNSIQVGNGEGTKRCISCGDYFMVSLDGKSCQKKVLNCNTYFPTDYTKCLICDND